MAAKKDEKDPTITTGRPATLVDGDSVAPIGTFKDNPDKPAPESVAQVQVLDE